MAQGQVDESLVVRVGATQDWVVCMARQGVGKQGGVSRESAGHAFAPIGSRAASGKDTARGYLKRFFLHRCRRDPPCSTPHQAPGWRQHRSVLEQQPVEHDIRVEDPKRGAFWELVFDERLTSRQIGLRPGGHQAQICPQPMACTPFHSM